MYLPFLRLAITSALCQADDGKAFADLKQLCNLTDGNLNRHLKVLEEAGLSHQLHAYGTNIEGEWDEVFAAIKLCHERVHAMGAPRITTSIKVGTRTDREQSMQEKVDSVSKREI